MVNVTAIVGLAAMLVGEGSHWVEEDQSLLMVDIPAGYVYRYFPETERVQKLKLKDRDFGSATSLVVPLRGSVEEFVVAVNTVLTLVNWTANDADHVLREPIELSTVEARKHNRFNDGKADPQGRLWAGTVAFDETPGEGSLYRQGADTVQQKILENFTIPNGLAWNSDRTKFYHIDSPTKRIFVYDYEDSSGDISNRQVLFDYEENGLLNMVPDGMTIDAEDNLWVACWGGSQVINVNTTSGKLIRSVPIPSLQVASCCFGGEDLTTLYVTTAARDISKEDREKLPYTGSVFQVTGLGVQGLPSNGYVLDKSFVDGLG